MSLIDLDNLKKELKRKMDLEETYEDITEKTQLQRYIGDKPFTLRDLDTLSEEICDIILQMREWTNGYIDEDTPITMKGYVDFDIDKNTPLVKICASGPESLGTWKTRLKALRTKLLSLEDPEAIDMINKKLEKLNELVSLPDNVTDVNEV